MFKVNINDKIKQNEKNINSYNATICFSTSKCTNY